MKVEKTIHATQAEAKKLADFMGVLEATDDETYDTIKDICGCNLYQALDFLFCAIEVE